MTNEQENKGIKAMNRAELVKTLSDSIKICAERATATRCRPLEGDETRLKYARCVAQLAGPMLSGLRDEDLAEIKKRLDALEGKQQANNTN